MNNNFERDKKGRFIGVGKGNKNTIISVGYPIDIYEILRKLHNRSDKIRQWVIEGMQRDGLLTAPTHSGELKKILFVAGIKDTEISEEVELPIEMSNEDIEQEFFKWHSNIVKGYWKEAR
jgi:hypothetical protein